jgi:hypothetical protein
MNNDPRRLALAVALCAALCAGAAFLIDTFAG